MSEAKKDYAMYVEDTAASSENAIVEEQEEKMTLQAYLAIAVRSAPIDLQLLKSSHRRRHSRHSISHTL